MLWAVLFSIVMQWQPRLTSISTHLPSGPIAYCFSSRGSPGNAFTGDTHRWVDCRNRDVSLDQVQPFNWLGRWSDNPSYLIYLSRRRALMTPDGRTSSISSQQTLGRDNISVHAVYISCHVRSRRYVHYSPLLVSCITGWGTNLANHAMSASTV